MSYLDKVLTINEKKSAPKRVNAGEGDSKGNPASDEYVSGGKTGEATPQGRLLKSGTKKKTAMAADRVKDHTAGPKGKLPGKREHIEYKRIGALMAEALGHRIDELAPLLGMAARTVGKKVIGSMAKKAVKKGAGMAADKMQKKGEPVEEEEQRQEMASNDELKKRKAARDKMNKKIGDMFAGPSVRKPKPENSWTVYHDLGYTIAEALGLVSEEVKQLPPVPPYKKPGELSAEAEAARKAGKKPAKPSKPDDKATADAMDRDKKMLRRRAGATGSESGSA